jgi:hypothetical protein
VEAVKLDELQKDKSYVKVEKRQQKEIEAIHKRHMKERAFVQGEQQKSVDRLVNEQDKGMSKKRWDLQKGGTGSLFFYSSTRANCQSPKHSPGDQATSSKDPQKTQSNDEVTHLNSGPHTPVCFADTDTHANTNRRIFVDDQTAH